LPRLLTPRRAGGDQGSVAILTVIFTVVIFAVAALAVDLGNAFSRRRQAQTMADLAALAGGKGLPDIGCAWALAYDYLNRNPVRSDDGAAWPPAVSQLSNGVLGDGEIQVLNSGGAPLPYAATASSTVPARCGAPATGDGRRVRVVTPPRTVNFTMAPVIGFDDTKTAAGATVEIRSLGGRMMPFGIPAGCQTYGFVSVKTTNVSGGPCDISTGSFGYLDFLYGGRYNRLFDVLRNGADHAYSPLVRAASEPAVPPDNPPCPANMTAHPSGTFHHDIVNPTGVPNCARIQTGNIASIITDAFIRSNSEGCTATGRLTNYPPSLPVSDLREFDPGGGPRGPCRIDGRRFASFLNGGVSLASAIAPTASDVIKTSITDSPNFFVVPVLYTSERPPNANNFYRIVDFRGFYIDYDDAACNAGGADPPCSPFETTGSGNPYDNNGQIIRLTGYSFSLDAIMDGANTGPNVSDSYSGQGPSVGVLIKDPLN
jgi:hypothetical protein